MEKIAKIIIESMIIVPLWLIFFLLKDILKQLKNK